jgi:hypothetical protein
VPRLPIVCALLALIPSFCLAADPPTETVVKMTVQPAAAPEPALRYQLLPELREMNPGNPIHAYMRCFGEQYNFYRSKEAIEDREKWQKVPLNELPFKDLLNYGGSGLRQADYAARLDTPDWAILIQAKKEGYRLLLPDLQQTRELAGALKVRFRAEVAARRFDDALVTAKTMFALGRHLGEHPAPIGELVGMAVAHLGLAPLEELIQQPGSPNLYWALTQLPSPMIDIRKGMQTERLLFGTMFDGFDEAEPMSEARLARAVELIGEMVKFADSNGGPKTAPAAWVAARAKDEAHVRAARRRLVESGVAEERLAKLPPVQVVLMDEKLTFETSLDEVLKVLPLPYWQIDDAALARPKDSETLFGQLVPQGIRVRKAQGRLDQRIALLRHVEALRLYAAANDGKLPARLDDVKVPLPVDPFTGKPFVYKLDGQTAVIQGTPPRGEEKNAAYNVRYEVTVRK